MKALTVVLRRLLWLGPLVVSGALALAQDNTGWRNPSAHSGAFLNPTRAYTDNPTGGSFATASHGQEHRYWGYTISIPAGREIVGIEVLLDARRHGTVNSRLFVELSWNGGTTWTATGRSAGPFDGTWRQLIVGSSTDTWGRTWTVGELTTTSFRVRLIADQATRLDWVAVRVHHRVPVIPLTLSVTPQLVDLGTLTLAHYDAGFMELVPAQRLTVSSPAAWSLHVAANAATWTYTGTEPSPGKPSSHLEWRVSAFGSGVTDPHTTYIGLTTTQHRVAGGTAGTGLWVDIALRLVVDYATTVPGTYTLGYTFTLTAP
jgi:hypothetical protein